MAKAVTSVSPLSSAVQYHWMPLLSLYQPTAPSSYTSSVRPPICQLAPGSEPSGAGRGEVV